MQLDMDDITTFANEQEFRRTVDWLEAGRLPHTVVRPGRGYARVGVSGLVVWMPTA